MGNRDSTKVTLQGEGKLTAGALRSFVRGLDKGNIPDHTLVYQGAGVTLPIDLNAEFVELTEDLGPRSVCGAIFNGTYGTVVCTREPHPAGTVHRSGPTVWTANEHWQ
jgi:hypothetical protein